MNPKAKERVGYPTQKPILLLEQIIKIVTDENDIVLDPFCGSGTTLVAAKLLGRRFIGIDSSAEAVEITKSRLNNLIKTNSNILRKGIKAYNNKTDQEETLLKTLKARVVQRNKGIDGFLPNHFRGKPIPIKIQKESESLMDSISLLEKAIQKKELDLGIVIKTHEDNALFDFDDIPDNILYLDHFQLIIEQWLNDSEHESKAIRHL